LTAQRKNTSRISCQCGC